MSVFTNIWKIKELRSRVIFTLVLVLICRLISVVPTPGIDAAALAEFVEKLRSSQSSGGMMGMLDLFTGGALANCSVGTLSIWPYINASIIIQLMSSIIPALEKLAREGDVGRNKLTQWTRYLTLFLCAMQSLFVAKMLESSNGLGIGKPLAVAPGIGFEILTMIAMTSATMLVMWLAEQITDRGIGNGMSVIIMVNICARLPSSVMQLFMDSSHINIFQIAVLIFLAFVVFAGTIMLTEGVRKVPLHAARGSSGAAVAGGQSTYMPLRVNFAGVMPIIFAGPIMTAIGWVLTQISSTSGILGALNRYGWSLRNGYGSPDTAYIITYALLILFFSFFWVATQFNAVRFADDLKRSNSYIPGIRPGEPTAEFLDMTMTRVTLIGCVGLILIAIIPSLLYSHGNIPHGLASFFGGTSLLIIVGVALDTMRQVEAHLIMRSYDGFLSHGRLRGRNG